MLALVDGVRLAVAHGGLHEGERGADDVVGAVAALRGEPFEGQGQGFDQRPVVANDRGHVHADDAAFLDAEALGPHVLIALAVIFLIDGSDGGVELGLGLPGLHRDLVGALARRVAPLLELVEVLGPVSEGAVVLAEIPVVQLEGDADPVLVEVQEGVLGRMGAAILADALGDAPV